MGIYTGNLNNAIGTVPVREAITCAVILPRKSSNKRVMAPSSRL